MTINALFLDFNGRIPRRLYILGFLFLFCLRSGISIMLLKAFGVTLDEKLTKITQQTMVFEFFVTTLFLWPNMALGVKRLHDLGWSASYYWVVNLTLSGVYLMAAVGAFTQTPSENAAFLTCINFLALASFGFFVVMLALRGTNGENRFGPDPLPSQ